MTKSLRPGDLHPNPPQQALPADPKVRGQTPSVHPPAEWDPESRGGGAGGGGGGGWRQIQGRPPAGVYSPVELDSQQRCDGPVEPQLWVVTQEWSGGQD